MSDEKPNPIEQAVAAKFSLKDWLVQWGPLILLGLMLLQNAGVLSSAQVDELKKIFTAQQEQQQKAEPTPEPAPIPAPTPAPQPSNLTPEQIAELIRKAVEEALKPKPQEDATPAPQPAPQPTPVTQVKIKLCDEHGEELTSSEIAAGELFSVSAVGCGPEIGWHPVESGDVKLSASTDGKEFCGYLQPGQWVEFSLTDFASKSQASMRVTCLTAPQPPPDDETKPRPQPPQPTARNVRIYVVYGSKISPDNAIVLNANEMWDKFTANGNDWKFINVDTDDEYEKQIVADAAGVGLSAVVIYDKVTGKKLTAEELPKSVIATEGLVERYTGASK